MRITVRALCAAVNAKGLFRRFNERLQRGRQLHVSGEEPIHDDLIVVRSNDTTWLASGANALRTEVTLFCFRRNRS